ncbi:MAG: nucleotidyltransferase domain-containing protein [Lachnospiraceae bacterium]|nr:nucleotidyltransferase domain-containing protein [Lachnospiraceae bacterium]
MNDNLKRTYEIVNQVVPLLEKEINRNCLFGAVVGSTASGLANTGSDIDFVMVTEGDAFNKVITKDYVVEDKEIGFMILALDDLLDACEKYLSVEHKYPICMYRTKEEEEIMAKLKPQERSDYIREMAIVLFFQSPKVIEYKQGILDAYKDKLVKGVRFIDIWNYQFVRIYGNFNNEIKEKKEVLIRKYLYTVYEIMLGEYLLKNENMKRLPTVNFYEWVNNIYDWSEDERVKNIVNKLYNMHKQQNLDKKYKVLAEPLLNEWIKKSIETQLAIIPAKEDILKNTYLDILF